MIVRFEALAEHHISPILLIEATANPAPWSDRSFRNELTNPQSVFVVAIGDGNIVGYGGYWRCIDEAHITTVAVSDTCRHQGIGMRIMRELLGKAKEEGMTCSTLEVRASNVPAVSLYEKLGYVTVARRKAYYPDNKEDALVMWRYELQESDF